MLAFAGEQPLARHLAHDVLIEGAAREFVPIAEQDALDQVGIHDKGDLESKLPVKDEGLLVEFPRPARHRIADDLQQQQGER